MKRLFICFALLAWTPSWAAQTKITDWWTTYYITKDDSRVTEFWNMTVARGGLKVSPQVREKLIGFFGAVFREKPDLLRANIKSIPKEAGVEQDGIVLILWLADQDYSRALLHEAGFTKVSNTPVPSSIEKREISYEEDVDFLEGWYKATGDTGALLPMVRLIKETDWAKKNEKADYAGSMLIEICAHDTKAQQYIRDFLGEKDLAKDARAILEQAIKEPNANDTTAPSTK